MPALGPIKRREFIRRLRGPYSGGKHQFMVRDAVTIRIPNPHQGDIGRNLLSRILRQAGITREQWETL